MYGYFPMSSFVVLRPSHLTSFGFVHDRPGLAAVYNYYNICRTDSLYMEDAEDLMPGMNLP